MYKKGKGGVGSNEGGGEWGMNSGGGGCNWWCWRGGDKKNDDFGKKVAGQPYYYYDYEGVVTVVRTAITSFSELDFLVPQISLVIKYRFVCGIVQWRRVF